MKKFILLAIKFYQKTLSLDHGWLGRVFPNQRNCRFTPSCSMYGYEAIEKHGVWRGGGMAINRFFRCNPWNHGDHYDPVK